MALDCSPDRDRNFAERETEGMCGVANHPVIALAALGSARRMRWWWWQYLHVAPWHAGRNLRIDGHSYVRVRQPITAAYFDGAVSRT